MKLMMKFAVLFLLSVNVCFSIEFFSSVKRQDSYVPVSHISRLQQGYHTIMFKHAVREPLLMATDLDTAQTDAVSGDYISVRIRKFRQSRWCCFLKRINEVVVVPKDGVALFLAPQDLAFQIIYQSGDMKKPVASPKYSRAFFMVMTQLVLQQNTNKEYFYTSSHEADVA